MSGWVSDLVQEAYEWFAGGVFVKGAVKGTAAAVGAIAKSKPLIANASNYRTLFMKARPDLPAGWQVHHSIPQDYEEVMRASGVNIHELQFLRGVSPTMHSKITTEWARFDKANEGNPTAAQVADFAKQIDDRYGGSFVWPGF